MSLGRLHHEACARREFLQQPLIVHPPAGNDEALKAPPLAGGKPNRTIGPDGELLGPDGHAAGSHRREISGRVP